MQTIDQRRSAGLHVLACGAIAALGLAGGDAHAQIRSDSDRAAETREAPSGRDPRVPTGIVVAIGPGDLQLSDLNADGSIAVGSVAGTNMPAWRWTMAGGLELLGGTGGQPGISDDGSVIAGDVEGDDGLGRMAIHVEGENWMSTGDFGSPVGCDGTQSSTYGLSASGHMVVGLGYLEGDLGCLRPNAVAWTLDTGTFAINIDQTVRTRANRVSADGKVIAGWYDQPNGARTGAYWTDEDGQWIRHEINPGGFSGEVVSMSRDGRHMGGSGGGGPQAWIYTRGEGVRYIGSLPDSSPLARATTFAISDDGRMAVGSSGFGFMRNGFIWMDGMGMQPLKQFLSRQGVEGVDDWDTLGTPGALSQDGGTIAGWGLDGAGFGSWIVRLEEVVVCLNPGSSGTPAEQVVSFPDGLADLMRRKASGARMFSRMQPGYCHLQ